MKIAIPVLLLPLCVALLQYHGIKFWTEHITGSWAGWGLVVWLAPWDGWGWSVMLEVGNLWAWMGWRRWRWFLMALVTTILLVGGPLYRVSDGLVRELAALGGVIEETARIGNQRALLAALDANARGFRLAGATGNLKSTETILLEERAKMDALLIAREREQAAAALNWRKIGIIIAQLAAIVIAQLLVIASIVVLWGGPAAPSQRITMYRRRFGLWWPRWQGRNRLAPGETVPRRGDGSPASHGDSWAEHKNWPEWAERERELKAMETPMADSVSAIGNVETGNGKASDIDAVVASIKAKVERLTGDGRTTQRAVAEFLGISARDLNLAVRHMENSEKGARTLALPYLNLINGSLDRASGQAMK